MLKQIFLGLLPLILLPARAQDSLVYFTDLQFTSPYEMNIFKTLNNRATYDPFALLIANGSLLGEAQIERARTRLYQYLESLNNEKFHKKNGAAKVKVITTEFRKNYLLKYVAGSRFEDIFASGNFSEISGTALYCLAFDYLNIPYSIKEEPTNVYVVAYPETNRIVVESTTTAITFFTFDNTFKQEFVESLRKQKIISEQEFSKSTVNALFDKYYLGQNQLITIRDLAAMQYLADGTNLLQGNDPEGAFIRMEKACFLSPTPKTIYLLMQTGSQAFLNHKKKDLKHAALLGKLSRYTGMGITEEEVSGELFQVIQDLLFNKGQPDQLDSYYQALNETIKKVNTREEIRFVYEYEKGRYAYNLERYNAALPYFENALQLKPTNQQAQGMVISSLSMLANSRMQDKDFVDRVEQLKSRHAVLAENNMFIALLAHLYLVHIAINFENNGPTEGERYRIMFEELIKPYEDLNLRSDLIGRAYSSAAIYYFKKGQTRKAQSYIDSGLKISPNNYELTIRKKMIR